ncbi:ligase-associated DNA damage response endonuclease PdeM [Defluviimonas sp. D31]|uniref:ligase-associated DNA damage response endonuclease PdeM n=1 Tax=Defluviimonas sp. D31 TaxID=3083253 RepID=UPI00296F8CC0|nr:ligase-associated DNA damage response endonuclease PdeM [Defluviimonas sp. D31]MDW4548358.1 ligase-associated DNA damage response endonuclease PdeM [Defluviimonas sp. D31]
MNAYTFTLSGAALAALPSGALHWAAEGCLVVSDLHLGRSERYARRAGALLPPYEVDETLARLDADIAATGAGMVICLGDTFDDLRAAELGEAHALWLARLMAGRRWVWIEGNHDPGPVALGGEHRADLRLGPLTFRHVAETGAGGEVSGHYHPKARLAGQARPCFLVDRTRVIMPAYGTYTGGLNCSDPTLAGLMAPGARAVLTGRVARAVPMPQRKGDG